MKMENLDLTSTNAKKRKRFPKAQEYGTKVYDVEKVVFRDNSQYLELLESETNVLFTRPPQLGKTTLWSLAKLMFSNVQVGKCPTNLKYVPPDGTRNEWYVIHMDFGAASFTGDASSTHWKQQALKVDRKLDDEMKQRLTFFMKYHNGLRENLEKPDQWYEEATASEILKAIAIALPWYHRSVAKKQSEATLLVLVDEYDKPVRDILFNFIGTNTSITKEEVAEAFPNYTNFFSACKVSGNDTDLTRKTWVTGITPVGLRLVSGFVYENNTFDDIYANAVGLEESDVKKMLEEAITANSFDDNELQEMLNTIRENFNSLGFPGGSPLFHTGMMNRAMTQLQKGAERKEWLLDIVKRPPEELPSALFNLIARSENRDLRFAVNRLIEKESLTEYSLIRDMTLVGMLEQEKLETDQYLTLLVHMGAVSARKTNGGKYEFKSTSAMYREKHLRALSDALKSSIRELFKLTTKKDMYTRGEPILMNFVTCLSQKRMGDLVKCAQSKNGNRILELQLHGNIVAQLFTDFENYNGSVETTQEDVLKAGRSDVTIESDSCQVVLELKKLNNKSAPKNDNMVEYHNQLRSYVNERRQKNGPSGKWVAGFVLVMYNDGKSYKVEALRDDDN